MEEDAESLSTLEVKVTTYLNKATLQMHHQPDVDVASTEMLIPTNTSANDAKRGYRSLNR